MFSKTPADKSFYDFYNESSFGQYQITGDVVGPYMFADSNCDYSGMANTITPKITKKYNHYVFYIGGPAGGNGDSACMWGGLGDEGSAGQPGNNTWINGGSSYYQCTVLDQEPGHNFGLMHANTLDCSGSPYSATASSCTASEYSDMLTPMGMGCQQLNGYERWYLGWLSGCNGVTVAASGTYNLVPLSSPCPGGIQVLQIPTTSQTIMDPQGGGDPLQFIYVELRAPGGTFDSSLGPAVIVYVAGAVDSPSNTSSYTYLLNMASGSGMGGVEEGLMVGQTFKDPAGGASVTLMSMTATGAVVNVTMPNGSGSSTCIGGGALSGSGPTTCTGGGTDAGTGTDSGGSSSSSSSGSSSSSSSSGSTSSSGGSTSSSSSSGTGSSGSSGTGSSSGGSSGSSSGSSSGGSGSHDAGGGSSTGSSGSSGGSDGGGGSDDGGNGSADTFNQQQNSGCGCTIPGSGAPFSRVGAGFLVAAAAGIFARRRRAPATQSRH